MMERHEESTSLNPNVYPEEVQLKLYQAFIFSIPILFSIILFLLFYLFYLKRRATHLLSSQYPRISHSSTSNHSLFLSPAWSVGSMKGELKEKLQVVEFDEELKARESLCCVCLGEFEMKEELRQLTLCKHVFHGDCIRHWLCANATCPLCRCPLISSQIKMGHSIGVAQVVNNNPTQQQDDSTRSLPEGEEDEHVIRIPDDPPSNITSTSSRS